jgi:hypothetical protein
MTQDEIIEQAKRAGIKRRTDVFFSEYCDGICFDDLEAFAKLVAEKEREACAKVCDDRVIAYQYATDVWAQEHIDEARHLAKAIRARGQA